MPDKSYVRQAWALASVNICSGCGVSAPSRDTSGQLQSGRNYSKRNAVHCSRAYNTLISVSLIRGLHLFLCPLWPSGLYTSVEET